MAESGERKLFRKKSLERLSSPERLDQLLEVVKRRSWIPLITLGVLILGLVVWSVIGRVPIHVEGKGILVRPRKVVEFQAPAAGRLLRLEIKTDDFVRKGWQNFVGLEIVSVGQKLVDLKLVNEITIRGSYDGLLQFGIQSNVGTYTIHIPAVRENGQIHSLKLLTKYPNIREPQDSVIEADG